ncbi:MAG: DUF4112 domain-containing protein [Phenylobacterium sp.]|uniref:DUF4112 domain-containing protein n=1 Tax=Phenylobacterium sp. TaxID=1871053 RepID=UPI0027360458|nr:DUF4112 domain-containing protein [Phenylobacterium sp.]MDP3748243.1 DUF4112 domain-containing protein [Phenylobacterium sp.]
MEVSKDRAHRAWRHAERIKRLSDRLVSVGPIGVGLDGVLAWVPVAGTVYSLGAGALLIAEGIAVGAKPVTLARMAAYIALDSASSVPPVVGWIVDTLFPGHLMAANALQKDIEARHGPSELAEDWRRGTKGRRGWRALSPKL